MINLKFWTKKKEAPKAYSVADAGTEVNRGLERAERKREILAWRDHQEVAIVERLKTEKPIFKAQLRALVRDASHKDIFLCQRKWLKETVQPVIHDWTMGQSARILNDASRGALKIAETHGGVVQPDRSLDSDKVLHQFADLASAVGPIAAGILSIPTVLSASVVSAGGLMGFFGATVIFWPVAIGGAILVGASTFFGGYRLAKFRDMTNNRIDKKLSSAIDKLVFGPSEENLCLCDSLHEIIRETAREQLQETP